MLLRLELPDWLHRQRNANGPASVLRKIRIKAANEIERLLTFLGGSDPDPGP